jgi:Amt family ammonium transporter
MISNADVVWVLVSMAFVMLMTPGLAAFYGGLVRNKNVLNTALMSFIALGVISIEWFIIGYSMSFGKDIGGIIGGFSHIFLKGVGLDPSPDYASTIPQGLFMLFQMMFAIITPALISGAIVERMKFSSYILFILAWSIIVYNPLCHWVWGKGGWLAKIGVIDFAGGIVVHISAGISALAAALVLGKRKGYPGGQFVPHNLPLAAIGAGLLWFGWFGFNGGSALGANKIAVLAAINTHIAGAAAAVTWVIAEFIHLGKPSTLGIISGLVAGLATITPASGFVPMWAALVIGLLAGVICYLAVILKVKMGFDDSLDAFSIHGVGGVLGTIALGIFASYGAKGLLAGNVQQFIAQIGGVIVTILYCGILTVIILKVIDFTIGLRVSEEDEVMGLDLTQHGEEGYKI